MKSIKKQNGFLVIVAVVVVVIFGLIAVIATYLVNTDVLEGANDYRSTQALSLADSGLSAATAQLINPTISNRIACANVTGNASLTNYVFTGAAGPFTVTSPGPQSATASTLSGALSASATTIPLANASSYAASGRVMIDRESIDYVGVSGNSLLNAIRGVDGTTAVAHISGTPVGQYQCALTSTGSAPSVNPSGATVGGQRTLQETVQLPEAIAVGNKSGSTGEIMIWNYPTEVSWNSDTMSGLNQNLNSVYTLSYAEGWAVGNSGTIVHWVNKTWSTVSSGTTRNLQSVFCTATNNCWAVGATRTVDLWNGSTWTVQSTAPFPNVQLNSVYCNSSTDCWIVGNTSGGDVMMHWNGSAWSRDPSRPTPAANLNYVVCTGSSNCWAVGASRTMLHWDGSAWSDYPITSMPNVAYNGIDCITSNDCWAVGNRSGGLGTIIHWNGSTWSNFSVAVNDNINEVNCFGTNNCWTSGAGGTTLHWDGSSWVNITNPLGVQLNAISTIGAQFSPNSAWQESFP